MLVLPRSAQGLVEAAVLGPALDFEGGKERSAMCCRGEQGTGRFPGNRIGYQLLEKFKKNPMRVKRVIRAGIKANRYIPRQSRRYGAVL